MKLTFVDGGMRIVDMEEKVPYLIDVSYNGYCERELICLVDGMLYFIPMCGFFDSYIPVVESEDRECSSIRLRDIQEDFQENRGRMLEDDCISKLETLDDLYRVSISQYYMSGRNAGKISYMSTREFLSHYCAG